MSLIMPDGSRTVSYGPPGSGFPQYEDTFMGQAAAGGNKAAQKLASLPSQQQQAKPQQQQSQPQQSQSKGLDMSAYKPGQAQPIQPPSQGTPYQPSSYSPPSPSVDYRQYSTPTLRLNADGSVDETGMVPPQPPSQLPTQYSPSFLDAYQPQAMTLLPPGSPPQRPMPGIPPDAIFRQPTNTQTYTTPGFTYSPGGTPQYGNQGNVANDPYNKPPPFVSTMTDMYGNPTTPEQFYPQQDAFIAQLLERMGQIQGGTWLGQGPPPADFGRRPDMNFGEMWNQGGQMVQDGWRNPFSVGMAQPIQPPPQGTPYQPGFGGGLPPVPDFGAPQFDYGSAMQQAWKLPAKPAESLPDSRIIHRHSPNDTLIAPQGPFRPGTFQPMSPPFTEPQAGAGPRLTPEQWTAQKRRLTDDYRPDVDPYSTYEDYANDMANRQYGPRAQGMAQPIQPPTQGTPYQPGFGGGFPPVPQYTPSMRDYTPEEFNDFRDWRSGRTTGGAVFANIMPEDRLMGYQNYEHYLQDQDRIRRNAYESPSPFVGGRLNSQYADMYAPPMGGGWYY